MTSLGLSSTSDIITFDQNWHHLCSTFAGGKDLFSDTQIRVIGRMEPEICTKMLKMWSEKLRPKFALKILISAHARVKMLQTKMLVARKPSCHDASTFLTRLKLIWPRSSLKTTKMPKKCLFCKKLWESLG